MGAKKRRTNGFKREGLALVEILSLTFHDLPGGDGELDLELPFDRARGDNEKERFSGRGRIPNKKEMTEIKGSSYRSEYIEKRTNKQDTKARRLMRATQFFMKREKKIDPSKSVWRE